MLDRDGDPAPHSIELERLTLGAVLIDPELRNNLRRLLRPHDFWREQHAAIWQAMLQSPTLPDFPAVCAQLRSYDGAMVLAGGPAYLAGLIADAAEPGTLERAEHHARQVRDMALRRSVIQAGGDMAALGFKCGADIALAGAHRALADLEAERPAAPLAGYPLTDLGNAERLAAVHGRDLRFCAQWGSWLVWDGRRWQPDNSREIDRRAIDTVRRQYAEAARQPDPDRRAALGKWALRSEADHSRQAMTRTARALLPILPGELDRDPWLLSVENGTVDLKTGELLPHRREDRITMLAPVPLECETAAPTWTAFLERILGGNQALIAFLQRAVGYSLTGDTREQVIFILHGTGANGKSTLLETLTALLGEYAVKTPTDTLLLKRGAGGIPADVARLRGARLVTAVEAEEGQRLAESLVKQMTGGDTLTARKLYGDFFEFRPAFKLWLATNHKPAIRGTDLAIWRRIRLVPFSVTIPEEEQDRALPEKLRAELPGILAWAVQGCLEWQRSGLGAPAEVRQATAAYRAEQDTLAAFLDERCRARTGLHVTVGELFEAYNAWCQAGGEHPMTKRELGRRLKERGFEQDRDRRKEARCWLGLGLLSGEEAREHLVQ